MPFVALQSAALVGSYVPPNETHDRAECVLRTTPLPFSAMRSPSSEARRSGPK